MLFDKLLLLLPPGTDSLQSWNLAIILAGGVILYFAGARLSRFLFALGLVTAGTLLGRRYHFQFDPRMTATIFAIIGGLIGFALHRILASLLLGIVAAVVSFLVLWLRHAPTSWDWAMAPKDLYSNLPPEIAHPLPVVAGTCLVAGFLGSLLFFRLGLALLYSALATIIILYSGLLLAQRHAPRAIPHHWGPQLALIFALFLISFGIQYRRRRRQTPSDQLPPADD